MRRGGRFVSECESNSLAQLKYEELLTKVIKKRLMMVNGVGSAGCFLLLCAAR
jgi:hypothetical protein